MNNNFVVSIPKELKNIHSKLFFGLTKRQLIGFGSAIAVGFIVFFALKGFSTEIAMYGLVISGGPIIFGTMYTKNGMTTEQWIKLFLEYKFINPQIRKYKITKRNAELAKERNMLNGKRKKKKTKTNSTTKLVSSSKNAS